MSTAPSNDQRIRADYSQPEAVGPAAQAWVPSPQPGVERIMLDREGRESGRATSIVRYAPGSRFPSHRHPGGEEILVLEGTFSEGERDHGAGWYMRNPPGSAHAPSSAPGATLFVKLCQMRPDDSAVVRIDTRDPARWVRGTGRERCPLFSGPGEAVSLERLDPGQPVLSAPPVAGAELLVLDGTLRMDGAEWPRGSWIRLPPGSLLHPVAAGGGATVYLKTGHLAAVGTAG